MSNIQTYALAVVEADMALFTTQHMLTRLREVDPKDDSLKDGELELVRNQLVLTGAIALLATCEGAFDDLTTTEDGRVVRAYTIALDR